MCRFRTLWRISVISLALATAACGDGGDRDSAFRLDWVLEYVPNPGMQEGPEVSCDDAGTPTVALNVQNVKTMQMFNSTFDCKVGVGQSQELPPGDYVVLDVSLKDKAGQVVAAWDGGRAANGTKLIWTVSRRGATYFGAPIIFSIQSFVLNWSVAKDKTPVMCAAVGAKTVRLVAQAGAEAPVNFDWPCDAHAGFSPAVRVGTYGLQVKLLDPSDKELWNSDSMTLPVTLSQRAILPPVSFSF